MKRMEQLLLRVNALYLCVTAGGLLEDVFAIFIAQGAYSRMMAALRLGVGLWRCARSWHLTAADRGSFLTQGEQL